MLQAKPRTGVLIDGANLYVTARAIGLDVDYKRLLAWLNRQGTLVRAPLYFTALRKEYEAVTIKPLIDWLKYNGYAVVTKETKEFIDLEGKRKTKGNMDGELIVHAMLMAPHIEELILFSGDGDFTPMVKAIQEYYCVKVTVVSSYQPNYVADELRVQCDTFIPLIELREYIAGENKHVHQRQRA